jgi:Ca2+-binding EF-hand superfamily protein
MKKTFAFSLAAAALLTAGSSVALAHGPGGECHGGKGGGPAAHFEELDANKDGAVSQAELLQKRGEHFDKADANKDGKLTKEERQAMHEARKQERFAKHDANKDGKLTKDELGKMPEHFQKRVDANGDGAITQAELAAHKGPGHDKRGRGPDKDGDKVVTRDEMKAKVSEHFTRLDENKDGKLTKDELGKGHHGKGRGHDKGHDRDRDSDEASDEA